MPASVFFCKDVVHVISPKPLSRRESVPLILNPYATDRNFWLQYPSPLIRFSVLFLAITLPFLSTRLPLPGHYTIVQHFPFGPPGFFSPSTPPTREFKKVVFALRPLAKPLPWLVHFPNNEFLFLFLLFGIFHSTGATQASHSKTRPPFSVRLFSILSSILSKKHFSFFFPFWINVPF